MKVGMLWFEEGQDKDVVQRIERASEYYRTKYGHKPNLCFVHPDTIGHAENLQEVSLKIKASSTLLQDHFWIGIEEYAEEANGI
jgi:hypothetical protein